MSRRIFYVCPSYAKPRGGMKQIYRHVDILHRHGHEAAVVHPTPGFRVTWFDNATPVLDGAEFRARFRQDHDYVVLAETLGIEIARFPGRRVIFNQNVFYGFSALGDHPPEPDPYRGVHAAIVVSEHNASLLRFAYPELDVLRVRCGVDSTVFRPRPLAEKQPQVVCVSIKGAATNSALFHTLASRRRHRGRPPIPWVFLRDLSQDEVARVMHESMFVVFPSVEEGLALVPLEAMLSGCVLLTHPSGPQREYVPAEFCFEDHDVEAMARTIEAIVDDPAAARARWQPICDAACARSRADFSLASEEASVLAAWRRILEAP